MPTVTRWWLDRSIRELANRRRGERLFIAYENLRRAFSFVREMATAVNPEFLGKTGGNSLHREM
jgi:hypothetical protein